MSLATTLRHKKAAPWWLSGPALQSHLAASRRLTAPQEMGTLFKALAVFPQGAPQPPGFA